jgi:hypothetical protein
LLAHVLLGNLPRNPDACAIYGFNNFTLPLKLLISIELAIFESGLEVNQLEVRIRIASQEGQSKTVFGPRHSKITAIAAFEIDPSTCFGKRREIVGGWQTNEVLTA